MQSLTAGMQLAMCDSALQLASDTVCKKLDGDIHDKMGSLPVTLCVCKT